MIQNKRKGERGKEPLSVYKVMRLIDYITKQHSNLYNHTLHEYGYNSDDEYSEGCEICHAINFQLGEEEVFAIEKDTNMEHPMAIPRRRRLSLTRDTRCL